MLWWRAHELIHMRSLQRKGSVRDFYRSSTCACSRHSLSLQGLSSAKSRMVPSWHDTREWSLLFPMLLLSIRRETPTNCVEPSGSPALCGKCMCGARRSCSAQCSKLVRQELAGSSWSSPLGIHSTCLDSALPPLNPELAGSPTTIYKYRNVRRCNMDSQTMLFVMDDRKSAER